MPIVPFLDVANSSSIYRRNVLVVAACSAPSMSRHYRSVRRRCCASRSASLADLL